MTDFQKGYKKAVDTFSITLNQSIQRNNGARTAEEVLAVYNDMVLHLNKEEIMMNDVEKIDDKVTTPMCEPTEFVALDKAKTKLEIIKLLGGL